jgi:3-oxoacyl-[acyl-carrier protein] reductase
VLAARTTADLERVAARCREAGAASVEVVPTDIIDEAQVRALVDRAVAGLGGIDVFVANAGISYGILTDKHYREVWTYDRDVVEKILEVNVVGTWLCIKAALPAIAEGGSVIVIGSETGRLLYPGAGIYAVSKATIDALATLASREAAQRGVRVNVLSPGGMVDTQLFGPKGMSEELKKRIPPLPVDVIVPAAVWLASDDSREVTGAFLSGREFNARPLEETRAALAAAAPAAPGHH